LSLERLNIADDESVKYASKEDPEGKPAQIKNFSPLEFLAELSQHILNTIRFSVFDYGNIKSVGYSVAEGEAIYKYTELQIHCAC